MKKKKIARAKKRHLARRPAIVASAIKTIENGRNGEIGEAPWQHSSSARTRRNRRISSARPRELDHAVQRYADLYDLAPTGYVSFDRSGRIEEINLAAAQLFDLPRDRLIGMPTMVFVLREDINLFLNHLLRCRCSDSRVESELRLKGIKGKIVHAHLSSVPVAASALNGALLYQ